MLSLLRDIHKIMEIEISKEHFNNYRSEVKEFVEKYFRIKEKDSETLILKYKFLEVIDE